MFTPYKELQSAAEISLEWAAKLTATALLTLAYVTRALVLHTLFLDNSLPAYIFKL